MGQSNKELSVGREKYTQQYIKKIIITLQSIYVLSTVRCPQMEWNNHSSVPFAIWNVFHNK